MICKVCHREGCQIGWHGVASNPASNVESPASNKGDEDGGRSSGVIGTSDRSVKSSDLSARGDGKQASRSGDSKVVGVRASADRKQRWSKDAYRAYMKEYMRKRRLSLKVSRGT